MNFLLRSFFLRKECYTTILVDEVALSLFLTHPVPSSLFLLVNSVRIASPVFRSCLRHVRFFFCMNVCLHGRLLWRNIDLVASSAYVTNFPPLSLSLSFCVCVTLCLCACPEIGARIKGLGLYKK